MEKVFVFFCLLSVGSAFLFFKFRGAQQRMQNICIYSTDAGRYQPKCFTCPEAAYTSVLTTCLQMASLPSNISYTQASCIETNCAVRRTKRSTSGDGGWFNKVQLHLLNRTSDGQNGDDVVVVGESETYVNKDVDWEMMNPDEEYSDQG